MQDLGPTGADAEFAAMVSHELRRPLHKVATFASLLTQRIGGDDDVARSHLERMAAAVDHMQRVIDALLSLCTADRSPLRESVDLTTAARGALGDLGDLVAESAASVTIGDLPTIEGEPTLMRSLFTNLIANAIRYRHPDRPPHIDIAGDLERRDGVLWCRVTVTDNGLGLPPGAAERAFRPFERFDRPGTGLGLGLALCRAVAVGHGGTIEATPAAEGGTSFVVWLPAAA